MTAKDVLRNANVRPLGQHNTSHPSRKVGGVTLDEETTQQDFNAAMSRAQRWYDDNIESYKNRRRQVRQKESNLHIISRKGYNELLRAEMLPPWEKRQVRLGKIEGLENNRGVPIFRFFPARGQEGVRPRRGGPNNIYFVVMHSFGRGWDFGKAAKFKTQSAALEENNGHNPARFLNGMKQLLKPGTAKNTGVHHILSLRGDLVNSVSWDNTAIHAGKRTTNYSIGIEHEEFMVLRGEVTTKRASRIFSALKGKGSFRAADLSGIVDHGPFSEEQFSIDAFILKKLEAFTGRSFQRFLGHRGEVEANIKNRVAGCLNHNSISGHSDPGAQFFLQPDFEIGVSDISTHPSTRDRPRAWELYFERWWSHVPKGSKISAYARIFEKMERMRSFDLQTEVFDPSLGKGPIDIDSPDIKGNHTVAAAEGAAKNKIDGLDRSQRMQQQTRSGLYDASQRASAASSDAWAKGNTKLARIQKKALKVPVIVHALGFNYETGKWENKTTENEISEREAARLAGSGEGDGE